MSFICLLDFVVVLITGNGCRRTFATVERPGFEKFVVPPAEVAVSRSSHGARIRGRNACLAGLFESLLPRLEPVKRATMDKRRRIVGADRTAQVRHASLSKGAGRPRILG